MASITATFPALTFGQRGVQTRDDFVQTQELGQDTLSGDWATQAGLWKTQANAVRDEVNALNGTATTAAGTATTKATLATDYAEKMASEVETGTYSSKEHAIGDLTLAGGSAKAWAVDTSSPDGTTTKSAKTHSEDAAVSAAAALASENAAAATYDAFDDRELGSKASAPTLDNDGNALQEGAQYWNSVSKKKFIWDGASWVDQSVIPTDHGSLTGLADDDHSQYHNDTRGDARYLKLTGGSLTGALNEARATVASHATTADIWGALGNQIDFTGTATVTAFPNAPQAGATRELICAGACSFTAGANMLIDGVSSGTVTCAAEDTVIIRAISTTQFKLTRLKADGTAQVSTSIGSGGTTANVPLMLTSASASQQSLTALTWNQAVTLPDATTLSLGVTVFGLYNNSQFPILIKDSSAVLLGFIPPCSQVICSLADKSTSAGFWNLSGISYQAISALSTISTGVASTLMFFTKVTNMGGGKYCIVTSLDTHLTAVIYDDVNSVFGTATIVRADTVTYYVNSILIDANSVLVVSTSGTTAQGVVLSVSGTTITVNTPASLTVVAMAETSYSGEWIRIIKVSSSYILSYKSTASAHVVAISISGTTVSFGSITATTGTATCPVVYDNSGVGIVLSLSSGQVQIRAFTVSGTTMTFGTNVATTASASELGYVSRQLDSGRVALIIGTASGTTGVIISNSGTVVSKSEVSLGIDATTIQSWCVHKVGNQLICANNSEGSANLAVINVLTDSAGTAVAGTDAGASMLLSATNSKLTLLGSSTSSMYICLTSSTTDYIYRISISGNNPSMTLLYSYMFGATITDRHISNPMYYYGLYDGHPYGKLYVSGLKSHSYIKGNTAASKVYTIVDDKLLITDAISANKSGASGLANTLWQVEEGSFISSISTTANALNIEFIKAV